MEKEKKSSAGARRTSSQKTAGTAKGKSSGTGKGKNAGAGKGASAAKGQKTRQTKQSRQAVQPDRSIDVPDIRRRTGTPVYAEVILWVVLAFCIILFFSNIMGLGGAMGNAVSRFFFGAFGVLGHLIPFLLFFLTAFLVANRGSYLAWIKSAASFLMFISLCAFCELLTAQFDGTRTFADYYMAGSELRSGGGVLGGLLCRIFCPVFGQIGAWIFLFVLILISAIVITERSLFDDLRGKSERPRRAERRDTAPGINIRHLKKERRRLAKQQKIQQDIDRMRADGQQRQTLEVRTPRRERKVRGVLEDTTFDPTLPVSQEIHEVVPPARKGRAGDTVLSEPFGILQPEQQAEPVHAQPEPIQDKPAESVPEMQFTIQRDGKTQSAAMPFTVAELQPDNADPEPLRMPDTTPSKREAIPEVMPDLTSPGRGTVREDAADDIPSEQEIPADISHTRQIRNPRSSKEEQAEALENVAAEIAQGEKEEKPAYVFPPIDLLKKPGRNRADSAEDVKATAVKLQQTLHNFGVNVTITNVSCGPAVTRYEIQPEQGVKVSRIVNLADDIKLNLAAADIRIEAPIPGKAAVGIEVPNRETSAVLLRELLESEEFQNAKSNISFAVGKDIAGKVVVADIAKMPHLLIAGATGSGKSVCINTLIMSILYKADPEDVKLIMIDPKVVELSVYNGIPHLFIPVVTDPKKASAALNWGVAEMTDRYQKFADCGVRDLKGYNAKIEALKDVPDDQKPKKLPQIVIIVDELADLMMVAPGEVEDSICRLAQLARAAGIHLIIATQRPSVNVITGLIKANMPSRIAFSVTSGVDSRTIIDMNGAEKLLGKGDMLFYPQGYQKPVRVQGAFVSDEEVGLVTEFLTQKNNAAQYHQEMEERISQVQQAVQTAPGGGASNELDSNFVEAGRFIIEKEKASIGMLQRVFKIGFNRAARIMDQLADAGVVGQEEGTKPRKVLMTMEEFERYIEESL